MSSESSVVNDLVSIIIPAYNAQATLARCIQACLDQTHPNIEVLVIDDGSTDNTSGIAQSFPIHYVRQENRGPAAARNVGARGASGDILAYTDADCVPRPDWIERLLRGFKEGIVAVGGTYGIANRDQRLARVIQAEIEARHDRFGDTVDFLGSFNVAYKKFPFLAVGGFDETFRIASAEDNDLAYRLADFGGQLAFVRGAIVDHYHPETLWPYLRTQMRHGMWRVKLYLKHPARAEGDKYAGRGELAAPPLACAMLLVIPWFILAATTQTKILFFPIVVLLYMIGFYIYLTRSTRKRITAKLTPSEGRYFHAVAYLRDIARGIGLARGVWTFLMMRKETP